MGHRQAAEAGAVIAAYLAGLTEPGSQKLRVWYSPFLRTRQSKEALLEALPVERIGKVREDELLWIRLDPPRKTSAHDESSVDHPRLFSAMRSRFNKL